MCKQVCQECQRRPARALVGGRWKQSKGHDVCDQCWRGFMEAAHARLLPPAPSVIVRKIRLHNYRPANEYERQVAKAA